ncbi:MAG TPA: hypothetical protein VGG68_00860 [Caulobacteraceae bacterium]|jgi:hypothetical protein
MMSEHPPLETIIHVGRMVIDAELARRILNERVYMRQRRRTQQDTALWVALLERGDFEPDRQIWFGLLDGQLHLLDGQHRLAGVEASGIAAAFQVMIRPVADRDGLHVAYTHFDRAGRPRSLAEMINALGLAEQYNLSRTMTREVWRAGVLIHFKFDLPHHLLDPVAFRDDDVRLSFAEPHWATAHLYETIIKSAPAKVKRRLNSAQVLAVALITLEQQYPTAYKFWKGIGDNDGLYKGDPRHTFLTWVSEHMFERTGHTGAMAASLAWNAFFEDRELTTIRVGAAFGVRIAGTTFRNGRSSNRRSLNTTDREDLAEREALL